MRVTPSGGSGRLLCLVVVLSGDDSEWRKWTTFVVVRGPEWGRLRVEVVVDSYVW